MQMTIAKQTLATEAATIAFGKFLPKPERPFQSVLSHLQRQVPFSFRTFNFEGCMSQLGKTLPFNLLRE